MLLPSAPAAALVVSGLLGIGLGSAVIDPADTARYLWAAVSGGMTSGASVGAVTVTLFGALAVRGTPPSE
ncbi:hypothetical protein GC722_10795 [Auraticoccus sp. F435]|uniref:Uncharacterized protein n=1 Tax=Auraticoccus cholistanensis TaxID=2656650 RepID=A0A6A9UYC8_9ACTN|nr:hypothetical protein [Auraticoccus cholistanensis]MVA76507.1 hypothetical protein [Auraticoccus cholistanensis]